jgi:hypothetical protein
VAVKKRTVLPRPVELDDLKAGLWSAKQVGTALGNLKPPQVYELRRLGKLVGIRVGGTDESPRWRFRPDDVVDYLNQLNGI